MLLSERSIRYFLSNVDDLNIRIRRGDRCLEIYSQNTKNHQNMVKRLDYDLTKFTSFLLKDEYGEWKTITDKLKPDFYSPDSFLENAEIPQLSKAFYYTFYVLERIPTAGEFFDAYVALYCKPHQDKETFHFTPRFEPKTGERGKRLPQKETLYLNSLKCRITRAYPSFLREIGALLMLLETDSNIEFYYDLNQDVKKDTDICAVKNGSEVSIALFNNTKSSNIKRTEKEGNEKHSDFKIIMLANFFGEKRNLITYGSIDLYNPHAINSVVDTINLNDSGYYVIGA